jgi:hypothetical protein
MASQTVTLLNTLWWLAAVVVVITQMRVAPAVKLAAAAVLAVI